MRSPSSRFRVPSLHDNPKDNLGLFGSLLVVGVITLLANFAAELATAAPNPPAHACMRRSHWRTGWRVA
jgi:hypothetical protein